MDATDMKANVQTDDALQVTNDNQSTNFMNNSIGPIVHDDGPKMGRNMGFPDMRYLDPDAQGPPVIEKTFYKEY